MNIGIGGWVILGTFGFGAGVFLALVRWYRADFIRQGVEDPTLWAVRRALSTLRHFRKDVFRRDSDASKPQPGALGTVSFQPVPDPREDRDRSLKNSHRAPRSRGEPADD